MLAVENVVKYKTRRANVLSIHPPLNQITKGTSEMTYTKDTLIFAPFPLNKQFIDLTGRKYDHLTVIGFAGRINRQSLWYCECECGGVARVSNGTLNHKDAHSCGCKRGGVIHGETLGGKHTTEYVAYHSAKSRCQNPRFHQYANYGGRGIEFRFSSFDEFLAEVGRKPTSKHSLDRIDVNGHYESGNIRWATSQEQYRNMTKNHWIEYDGESLTLSEWGRKLGIHHTTLDGRINHAGWCIPCALTLPPRSKCSHKTYKYKWLK